MRRLLKRLVDDASAVLEIRSTVGHERIERDRSWLAAATRLQHGYRPAGHDLHLPDALPAIAAVLLDDTRPSGVQPLRKFGAERIICAIELGVCPPAKVAGRVENFLHAHLLRHIGMGTDPDPAAGNLAQHGIKFESAPTVGERIDPDKDTVRIQQLLAYVARRFLAIDRRLRINSGLLQGRKHEVPSVVDRCCVTAGFEVTAP